MSTDLIIRAGEALWGTRWQAEMAEALGVARSTVQDWRQGKSQPRPGVYADLQRIAARRQIALGELVEALDRQR